MPGDSAHAWEKIDEAAKSADTVDFVGDGAMNPDTDQRSRANGNSRPLVGIGFTQANAVVPPSSADGDVNR